MIELQDEYDLFINGNWQKAKNNEQYEKYSPVNSKLLTRLAKADLEDVDYAVKSAKIAFNDWRKTTNIERSNILLKIADRFEKNLKNLAMIETIQTGKPIRETMFIDIPQGIEHLRYFAGVIRSYEGKSSFLDNDTLSIIEREPLGVVGQIIPWNFPFLMAMWKIAPALASGNCIVLKPASETPLSILEAVKLIEDILPKGVLNIITGSGETTGNYLIQHPEINKLAFTGSTAVGYDIALMSAKKLIPVTLELGGKSANIFFDDMPKDKALEGVCMGILLNQGQVCSAGSRVFIQDTIYDRFLAELKNKFNSIKLGLPWDENTQMGSLINHKQLYRCLDYVKLALDEGAKLICGGKKSQIPELKDGAFIEPTILADVDNSMQVAQEEIFGPVLCVIKFHSEEEVIKMANDSEYGLAGGVWTKDINRAIRVAKSIETGKMWVNCYAQTPAGTPFGGYKKSGLGREAHKMVLDSYTQVKNIYISTKETTLGMY